VLCDLLGVLQRPNYPCNTCACGCPANRRGATCSTTAQSKLLSPEALFVPFDNRSQKAMAWAELKHYNASDWFTAPAHSVSREFTAPAHSVSREPGRTGTTISGVCVDAGKWPQNDLFCIHPCRHHYSHTCNQTDAQPKSTCAMIQDGMVRITNQVECAPANALR
jgi:hypothetical protein